MSREIIRTEERGRRKVRVYRCDCGRVIACPDFTNTCDCGADYNSAGQRLAPRSQWGEETGEHWSDCVGPFDPDEVW